jgi:hypothetical protein
MTPSGLQIVAAGDPFGDLDEVVVGGRGICPSVDAAPSAMMSPASRSR